MDERITAWCRGAPPPRGARLAAASRSPASTDRGGGRRGRSAGGRTAGRSTTGSSPTWPSRLALWRIREDGAGLASRATGPPGQAGWEDAAVPPDRLGGYLRDFDDLLVQHGLRGVPYGHFGDGCVHIRIDFGLRHAGRAGRLPGFVEDGARLAASYGGSLSGSTATVGPAPSCSR